MKLRVLTGLVISAITLLVVLVFPVEIASLIFALVCFAALVEFVAIVRQVLPSAPLRILYPGVALLAAAGFFWLREPQLPLTAMQLLCLLTGLGGLVVLAVLFGGTEMKDAVGSLGVLTFALPYFVLPQLAYFWLIAKDRWLVFLLIALVGMGDTFAYFVGKAWGKHKLAPIVSPKKSWEGAVAGLLASVLTTALWAFWRFDAVDPRYLALAAVTALAGQIGDLVESLVKRGAGVKDSSGILPGHGGLYDRIDALLLAAPVFAGSLWLLGVFPEAG